MLQRDGIGNVVVVADTMMAVDECSLNSEC